MDHNQKGIELYKKENMKRQLDVFQKQLKKIRTMQLPTLTLEMC